MMKSLFTPNNKSALSLALADFYNQRTEKSQMEFFRILRDSVDKKVIVSVPVINERGFQKYGTFEKRGQKMAVMFSDESKVSNNFGERLLKTDLPSFIRTVYNDPHLQGIAIDPASSDSICITRSTLPDVTGIPDPRRTPRNWGIGIPRHSQYDLMTEEEIFDFAMQVVRDFEMNKEGYAVIDEYNCPALSPNFIAVKNGKKYYITVKAGIAPKIPELTLEEKLNVIAIASGENAIACFASVSFGSSDMARFNSGLALCGDGFYTRYTGLEFLLEPGKYSDPMIYALYVLCSSYSTGNFSQLIPLLAEDVELHSMWVWNPLKGKGDVSHYLLGKGETLKKNKVFPKCTIVQLIGNMNTVRSDNIYVRGERQAGSVGLAYQDGKYCMLGRQELPNEVAEGIFELKLTADNKIKEISMNMPEFYRFRKTDLFP